jgi:hypothetical protein
MDTAETAPDVLRSWYWTHVPVNFFFDVLVNADGTPLRASRIRVWADDIRWYPDARRPTVTVIQTPNGMGTRAEPSFRWPDYPRYGIILYQLHTPFPVFSTIATGATEYQLNNQTDIGVGVNDTNTRDAYLDNGGAYTLHIDVLQP